MLDDRKKAILRAVIETYIETDQPVGSAHISDTSELGVSAATIRNEMLQLDQQGYLTQPHKSAGRVPTDLGYRAFVDDLDEPALEADKYEEVKLFFDQRHGEIEQMLDRTSRLLSEMTGMASVVVAPQHGTDLVRSVQLVQLAPRLLLTVTVLSDGTVEKGTIETADDIDEVVLAIAHGHLSAVMVGRTLADCATPTPSGNETADRLVDAARAVLTGPPESRDVFVGGRASVADFAVDHVREVLSILEKQLVVVTLLRDVLDRGLSVAIGNETGVDPLVDCSLVVAPYEVSGDQAGTIGLLGPTRMNYPQAMAAVAVVSQSLGKRLTEG